MKLPIDTSTCPLCGQNNNCMAPDHQSCWCNNISVPVALIALVPAHLKRQSCICRSCIELFQQNPDHFLEPPQETKA